MTQTLTLLSLQSIASAFKLSGQRCVSSGTTYCAKEKYMTPLFKNSFTMLEQIKTGPSFFLTDTGYSVGGHWRVT